MILLYCYIAGGLAFYFLFEQAGGLEAFGMLHPGEDPRLLVAAIVLGCVLWPIPVLVALLERGDR